MQTLYVKYVCHLRKYSKYFTCAAVTNFVGLFSFQSWSPRVLMIYETQLSLGQNKWPAVSFICHRGNCCCSYNQSANKKHSQWPLLLPHPLSSSSLNLPTFLQLLFPLLHVSLSLISLTPLLSHLPSPFLLLLFPHPSKVVNFFLPLLWVSGPVLQRRRRFSLLILTVVGMRWLGSISQKNFWVLAMRSQYWQLGKRARTRWRSLHLTDSQ